MINEEKKPKTIIKSILAKLTHWHILHVIDKFNAVKTPIKNKKRYIQTMIYNAVLEQDISYINDNNSNEIDLAM
jgi:hypothetical protein